MIKTTTAVAIALTSVCTQAEDLPNSWPDWESSKAKGHQTIVSQIKKKDAWENCMSWGIASRKKVKTPAFWAVQEYLRYHNAINGPDLGGVNSRIPTVGMTTCGVYAVLGRPNDINRTDSAAGTRSQYVYRDRRVYVYTSTKSDALSALVTSVQH